jgi:hypothetical protein
MLGTGCRVPNPVSRVGHISEPNYADRARIAGRSKTKTLPPLKKCPNRSNRDVMGNSSRLRCTSNLSGLSKKRPTTSVFPRGTCVARPYPKSCCPETVRVESRSFAMIPQMSVDGRRDISRLGDTPRCLFVAPIDRRGTSRCGRPVANFAGPRTQLTNPRRRPWSVVSAILSTGASGNS